MDFTAPISLILNDFMMRSLIAGVLLSVPIALTGCFLMWRRMVFLGDTLSHGAILGVATGLLLQVDTHLAVIVIALLLALILSRHPQNHLLPLDTWMSIISYSSLSLGVILLGLNRGQMIEPDALLFGDILAISRGDLLWILGIAVAVSVITLKNWRVWLLMTINEDLCATSGISVQRQRLLFVSVVAMVIAIGMKMIGALLLPALMVLPVATVSRFAKSPEQMVIYSSFAVLFSYLLGFKVSFNFDVSTGPTIVVVATGLFLLAQGVGRLVKRNSSI